MSFKSHFRRHKLECPLIKCSNCSTLTFRKTSPGIFVDALHHIHRLIRAHAKRLTSRASISPKTPTRGATLGTEWNIKWIMHTELFIRLSALHCLANEYQNTASKRANLPEMTANGANWITHQDASHFKAWHDVIIAITTSFVEIAFARRVILLSSISLLLDFRIRIAGVVFSSRRKCESRPRSVTKGRICQYTVEEFVQKSFPVYGKCRLESFGE